MTTTIPWQVVKARRAAGLILVLSALTTVVLLLVLLSWWATQPPTVGAMTETTSNMPTVVTSMPTQTMIQSPVSPQVALQQEIESDRPQGEALVGYWVPQLSSKTIGLKADGIVYGYNEILDHFSGLKARYPQALLLRSDDYTSFNESDFWIIVMPVTYGSGTEANTWCDAQGIDPDNCFAKLLLHAGGPKGTTLSRK